MKNWRDRAREVNPRMSRDYWMERKVRIATYKGFALVLSLLLGLLLLWWFG